MPEEAVDYGMEERRAERFVLGPDFFVLKLCENGDDRSTLLRFSYYPKEGEIRVYSYCHQGGCSEIAKLNCESTNSAAVSFNHAGRRVTLDCTVQQEGSGFVFEVNELPEGLLLFDQARPPKRGGLPKRVYSRVLGLVTQALGEALGGGAGMVHQAWP